MTRKALRKRRRVAARAPQAQRALRPAMPWAAVSALVASTAFGARPASAEIVDAVLRASRTAASGPASPILQDTRPQAPRRFDIPPAPLADVIGAFERAAGVTLTLSLESLGSIQSPGVSGTFTIDEALRRLLAGTSV